MRQPGARRWQLAGAYLGGVIGAGFASGQEHLQFFLAFGNAGYWGLLVAGAVLTIFGGVFLRTAQVNKTESHIDLLHVVSSAPLTGLFDIVLTAIMLTSVSVMMAGGGALLEKTIGIPLPGGAFLLGGTAATVVSLGFRRMLSVNGAIAALLVVIILAVGVRALLSGATIDVSPLPRSTDWWGPRTWYGSAALYAAYNLTYSFSLFGALGAGVPERREAWWGGVIGGGGLALLGFSVCVAVAAALPGAAQNELPMSTALTSFGPVGRLVYLAVIWLAMLTTAIAGTYTLARRIEQAFEISLRTAAPLVVAAAAPLSLYGFSFLVGTVYPLSGYVGAGCLAATMLSWWVPRRARK